MKQLLLLFIAFLFINKTFSQNLDWVFKPQKRVYYHYIDDIDLIWKFNGVKFRYYVTFFERNGKQKKIGNFSQTQGPPSDYFTDLIKVSKNGKFGFINKEGKLVIDAKYKSIPDSRPENDCQEFVYASVDGKNFGVIDKQGTVVIPFRSWSVWPYNFTVEDPPQVVYNKKAGLVIVLNHGGGYSIVNSNGTPVTPLLPEAPIIISVKNNYTAVKLYTTPKPQYYKYNHSTKNLEKLSENVTEENGLMFYGDYAPMDNKGCILLDDTFEKANKITLDSTSGLASVKTSNGWQMIDREGKPLTNDAYSFIFPMEDNGLAYYRKNNLPYSGFIDKTGKEVAIASKYDNFLSTKFINDLIIFRNNNLFGVFGIKGNIVVPPIYTRIRGIGCDCNFLWVVKDDKIGVLTKSGKEFLAPIYDHIGMSYNSPNSMDTRFSFIKDDASGIIDSEGKIILSMKNAKVKLLTYDLAEITMYEVGKGEVINNLAKVNSSNFKYSVGVARLPDSSKK